MTLENITREEYKAKTGNSSGFKPAENFIIYNTTSGNWLESHHSRAQAERFTKILNDHQQRNGHLDRYDYKQIKIIG
jgi:hypothetical protein